MSDIKNIRLGVCGVYYGTTLDSTGKLTLGAELGHTIGGVEVSVSTETHPVNVDQFGKSTVADYVMKRDIKVKVPMAETTLDNLALVMPGVTLTGSATATNCATVKNGTGINLASEAIDGAKGLLLRPVDKPDGSDDLFIPAAATPGAMNFTYMVDKERIFNVEFTGYPYSPSNGSVPNDSYLFKLGDVTACV